VNEAFTEEQLSEAYLTRELDKVKSQVFIGNSAAFFGSLMCSMDFVWDESIPMAATDGCSIFWNPGNFLSLPIATRKTILVHELWHPARLHFIRQGSRDRYLWNLACDHRINNDLVALGYTFESWNAYKDPKYANWAEEDIYDDLVNNLIPPPPGYDADMLPGDKQKLTQTVNSVVRAVNQAKASGGAGGIPGNIEELVRIFLAPVIPWEQVLQRFMTDLVNHEYTWKHPNKRYSDMYLPSHFEDDGRLEHLIYYQDVSGSISLRDATRFNSEVKYVKDTFNPRKLTLVQFDTQITQEIVFNENDRFDEVKIIGRGGTSLVPVREHIINNRPTAAIIFSDLECTPMSTLPFELPVIWVAINATGKKVPFGQLIHIKG